GEGSGATGGAGRFAGVRNDSRIYRPFASDGRAGRADRGRDGGDFDRYQERDAEAVHQTFLDGNVRLSVTKDALKALAAQAVTKGTGARALQSMLERIMLDIMYDVPSREDIAEVTINRAVVEGKKLPLIRKKQDKTAA